ncbi:putative multi-drug efflux transporter [Nocardioides luteus]|uniref:Multi-drug efflux transporter n=1 Tax=Nocardioides luteus TaxID=1844 RepID=A0ABQ5T0Q5_9ACTN|nr:putative multi-drug efflux transporter [Nocardioides luteus]GLJ70030.1 putative multi-drug efflux transporter [Nocardioides luteus]
MAAAFTVTAAFGVSNAPTPLYGHWQDAWGFGDGVLTVVFGVYMLGLALALAVGGPSADRYGRKAVLLPGLAASALSCVLFVFAGGIGWLLVARLAAGLGAGAAITAGMAAAVDLAGAEHRRAGALFASTAMVIGAGLGPLIAGGIIQSGVGQPQTPVFVSTLAIVAVALVIAFRLPLTPPGSQSGPRPRFRWPTVPRLNRGDLARGLTTYGPGLTITSLVLSLGPTILSRLLEESRALLAGVIVCVMFLAAAAVQFALARLSVLNLLALSSVCAIASMAALAVSVTLTPSVLVFFLAAVLGGAAQGLGQLAGLTLLSLHVPATRRAEANAALNISAFLSAALISVLTGYASDLTGLRHAVELFAAVLAAFASISLVVVRRRV